MIKPQFAIETLHKVTRRRDFYLTSDVGQHQMFAAQFYPFEKPRRWINSGGLGTTGLRNAGGHGLCSRPSPRPRWPVSPARRASRCASRSWPPAPSTTCPSRSSCSTTVTWAWWRQWQELFYEGRYSHSYVDALPDFARLAETYGHVGMTIEDPADLEEAYKEAFGMKDRLVFMNVLVDPEENVYPMIEAGKGHHEMHMSPYLNSERELA